MLLGYNTNGFASHALLDAIEVIGELGYRSIAITLDHHALAPRASDLAAQVRDVRRALADHELVAVIETGARFLLDPFRKHQPTLLDPDLGSWSIRQDFLLRAIELAAELGAEVVSLWSGATATPADDAGRETLDDRLATSLAQLCQRAAALGRVIGFEPEPGMYVEDLAGYRRIAARVGHPALRLTLDVGHAFLTEPSVEGAIAAALPDLVNVHVEGMPRGRHDHMVPWEGDLDVAAALRALRDGGYAGPATYELSRHSHDAVEVARRALAFARAALEGTRSPPPTPRDHRDPASK